MAPLKNKEFESHVNKNTATIAKKNLRALMITIIIELEIIVIIHVNTEVLNISYQI